MGIVVLWLRGLAYTVAAVILIGTVLGMIWLIDAVPEIGVPALILIILPLVFGALTEGDS